MSTARLRAVSVSQARGWGGTPVRGHVASARTTASWTASSRELQVAGVPDERRQHAPALVAHEADEGGAGRVGNGHPKTTTGRSSTAPCQAPGIRAAVAIASSRSAHSSR